MNRRIMEVTSSTTLDLARGAAHGLDWVDEAAAVVDVGTAEDDQPAVKLEIELDPTDLAHVEDHADTVLLSATQARTLAADLREAAGAVDDGNSLDV